MARGRAQTRKQKLAASKATTSTTNPQVHGTPQISPTTINFDSFPLEVRRLIWKANCYIPETINAVFNTVYGLNGMRPLPVAFHVNKESRTEACRHFILLRGTPKRVQGRNPDRKCKIKINPYLIVKPLYFNPKVDLIAIQSLWPLTDGCRFHQICIKFDIPWKKFERVQLQWMKWSENDKALVRDAGLPSDRVDETILSYLSGVQELVLVSSDEVMERGQFLELYKRAVAEDCKDKVTELFERLKTADPQRTVPKVTVRLPAGHTWHGEEE